MASLEPVMSKSHAQFHVTLTIQSAARSIVTVWNYIYLKPVDSEELANTKLRIIALASLEPELGKVTAHGHVTLTYKVTLD